MKKGKHNPNKPRPKEVSFGIRISRIYRIKAKNLIRAIWQIRTLLENVSTF
jgi:hypothetical protein